MSLLLLHDSTRISRPSLGRRPAKHDNVAIYVAAFINTVLYFA